MPETLKDTMLSNHLGSFVYSKGFGTTSIGEDGAHEQMQPDTVFFTGYTWRFEGSFCEQH